MVLKRINKIEERTKTMRTYLLLIAISFMMVCHAIAPSDSVHEKDRETLKRQATVARTNGMINGMEAFEEIVIKYHIPKGESENIRRLLTDRETRKFACNFTHKDSARERVLEKMRIDSIYQDSLDIILIPYNKGISGDNISYAMLIGDIMKLDSAQETAVRSLALDISRKYRKNPRLDVWKEEMAFLTSTLNSHQQDVFFSMKNAISASDELRAAWKKVKEAGLAEQTDSAEDCAKAYFYFLERQKIKDIYRHDRSLQRKCLADLGKRKPLLLKLTDGIEREAKMRKDEETQDSVGKDFVW